METFIHKYNIDETLCDELIHYHKTNDEYKMQGCFGNDEINKEVKDSIDVMYFNPSNNSTIIKYFETLSFGVKEYVKKYLVYFFQLLSNILKRLKLLHFYWGCLLQVHGTFLVFQYSLF